MQLCKLRNPNVSERNTSESRMECSPEILFGRILEQGSRQIHTEQARYALEGEPRSDVKAHPSLLPFPPSPKLKEAAASFQIWPGCKAELADLVCANFNYRKCPSLQTGVVMDELCAAGDGNGVATGMVQDRSVWPRAMPVAIIHP